MNEPQSPSGAQPATLARNGLGISTQMTPGEIHQTVRVTSQCRHCKSSLWLITTVGEWAKKAPSHGPICSFPKCGKRVLMDVEVKAIP